MQRRDSGEFETAARAALAAHEASEIVRRYQQGFGRPIISVQMNGFRLVAVGKTIKWSRGWRFFTDFLLDHLKDTIGRPWAIQAQREGKTHPIFDWLSTMTDIAAKKRSEAKGPFRSDCKGHLGALWRLGYALYLIEHNDVLDARIVKRLRSPVSFRPTFHETQIASAFAVAGFNIRMAEIGRTSASTPEFWAARGYGLRYAVEAKCKDAWNASPNVSSIEFQNELRQWLRNQLYSASRKRLKNPVYCFELSMCADFNGDEWATIAEYISDILKEAETLSIKGEPPTPAYVIVTNNVDVLADQAFDINRVAMLFGFCMDDWFESGASVEIEVAFDSHDKHRDIYAIFQCLQEVEAIPQSFDGLPVILDEEGNEVELGIRVGGDLNYLDANGASRVGLVYDVTSVEKEAFACVESDGDHHIIKVPLTDFELEAVKRYGDAAFGKPEKKRSDLEGDPLKFYDWISGVYEKYDRKALLIQVKDHPRLSEFSNLPIDELRVRAAREVTKAVVAQSGRPGQL